MPRLDDLSDETLVRRMREGEPDALRVLTERHAARLQARIRRRLFAGLSRKVAVSDILQEANIVAAERMAGFQDRGAGSYARWFGRIVELKIKEVVRRYAGTQRRDVAREVSNSRLPPSRGIVSPAPTPSEVLAGEELKDAVRRALKRLSAEHQRVLRLLQGDGLSLDHAAAALGRTREATRKLYARALLSLRAEMGQEAARE